jgi:hypothetical protein
MGWRSLTGGRAGDEVVPMKKKPQFELEADLVAAFCRAVDHWNDNRNRQEEEGRWTAYHETAGFDLLLVHSAGYQIGIEAKLSLNPEVLLQAIPNRYSEWNGPDYRAVLVPTRADGWKLAPLAERLGITVLSIRDYRWRSDDYVRPADFADWLIHPGLPGEGNRWASYDEHWHSWLPVERCKLPDYVPDVVGGKPSPVSLTPWKVKAIKLFILLDRRGMVTRADMKALELSPSRFCDPYTGFLKIDRSKGGYVRHAATPDLRAQHPVNYAEIEADYDTWARKAFPGLFMEAA